jgi:two-component system chemotaxis response regulator CheY
MNPTTTPPFGTPIPQVARHVRVLCVEDAEFVQQLYRIAFRRRGDVTSFEAHDGLEALSVLDKNGPVDVAIVDVNMPVMDGIEFVQHLRRQPKHAHTYVLLATTEDNHGAVKRALDGGPGDFLRKPFTLEEFIAKLDAVVTDAQGRPAS